MLLTHTFLSNYVESYNQIPIKKKFLRLFLNFIRQNAFFCIEFFSGLYKFPNYIAADDRSYLTGLCWISSN